MLSNDIYFDPFSVGDGMLREDIPLLLQDESIPSEEEHKAALKIQHFCLRYIRKRLLQASDDVRALPSVEAISEISELKVGTMILQSTATPQKWNRHAAIYKLEEEVENEAGNSGWRTTVLHLVFRTTKNATIYACMNCKRIVGKSSMRSTHFHSLLEEKDELCYISKENNYLLNIDKVKNLIDLKGLFKVNYDFSTLDRAFKLVAEERGFQKNDLLEKKTATKKNYSRQYNCNHIIYDTLRQAFKSRFAPYP